MDGHRGPAVSIVVLGAFVLLPGCADESVRLTQPGGDPDGWFGASYSNVSADDKVLLIEEVNLCLSAPGSAEVVDVTVETLDGELIVEDFAVRPAAGDFPEWERGPQQLVEVGFVALRIRAGSWGDRGKLGPVGLVGVVSCLEGMLAATRGLRKDGTSGSGLVARADAD